MSAPGGASEGTTLLLILWVSIAGSDALEMTIFKDQLEVFQGQDVVLDCKVTGYTPAVLNLSFVAVEWRFVSTQQLVYSFNGGFIDALRPGATVTLENLKRGDASLHLPKVQIEEEGEYKCIVYVTPSKAEKSSSVRVLAKPKITLSERHFTINNGSEGALTCDVNRFYPKTHGISWVKVSRGVETEITTGIITQIVVNNSDRTFSVSSKLNIRPTLDDDGNRYRCVVKHRAFSDNFTLEAELTVVVKKPQEPAGNGPGAVIGGVVGLLVIVLLAAAAFCFWKKWTQAPPKITEILKPVRFIHGQRSDLSWEVTGFKPKEIEIVVLLTRKRKEQLTLFVWKFPKDEKRSCQIEEGVPLVDIKDGCERVNSFTAEPPRCVQLKNGTFSVKCLIGFCPDVSEDDGAQMTVKVHHKILKTPLEKSVKFDVEVPPTMTEIKMPTGIVHGDKVALTWEVNGFNPQAIEIAVLVKRKVDQEAKELFHWQIPEKEKQTIPSDINPSVKETTQVNSFTAEVAKIKQTDNGTFSVNCSATMCADVSRDNGAEFTVRVKHTAMENPLTGCVTLHVAAPPTITDILLPTDITHGDCSTLSWSVSGFNPRPIEISCEEDRRERYKNTHKKNKEIEVMLFPNF
eukprot:gi/632941758/ref/XP_007886037.1/ PREDICTED: uncharacterized protein LOC103175084 [Callorhinchus milii]